MSFWDQRDHAIGPRPDPYGYGSVHGRDEINRALRDPRPYERLGYHPAIADPRGTGSHGTRTMDIAAGNGEANGPAGIAPDADLIFVHLADRNTGGLANFGDSVRLLEAVDFICRAAATQPCVINISAGRLCGPRDGTTLVERAFDELLASTPGRFIVDSAGNYFRWRAHSCGTIAAGETLSLTVVVHPADVTLNEVEIWYDGADEFAVRVDPPGYAGGRLGAAWGAFRHPHRRPGRRPGLSPRARPQQRRQPYRRVPRSDRLRGELDDHPGGPAGQQRPVPCLDRAGRHVPALPGQVRAR